MSLILPPRLYSQNTENLNRQTYSRLKIPFTQEKKILHFIFRGFFFLNLTVTLTNIMPKGLVQVAKFKVA